jgi:hypothetical protein
MYGSKVVVKVWPCFRGQLIGDVTSMLFFAGAVSRKTQEEGRCKLNWRNLFETSGNARAGCRSGESNLSVIALHALQGCIMECGCEVCDVLRLSLLFSARRSDEEDHEAQPPAIFNLRR